MEPIEDVHGGSIPREIRHDHALMVREAMYLMGYSVEIMRDSALFYRLTQQRIYCLILTNASIRVHCGRTWVTPEFFFTRLSGLTPEITESHMTFQENNEEVVKPEGETTEGEAPTTDEAVA